MKKNKSAIVGIGSTDYTLNSGRSLLSLGIEACGKAIEDSGLDISDVDGILTFNARDSVSAESVATSLALPNINYAIEWYAGGFAPSALVQLADLLVTSNTCKSVLIFRAMNGRSGYRLGGAGWDYEASGMWQYRMPHGYLTYPQTMAMWCRRHMLEFGTKPEELGAIAINQRSNAVLNEKAIKRTPISMEDYLSSRMIVDPFRILDITLECDGACALLVASSQHSKDCKKPPVYIKASAFVGSKNMGSDWADFFLWEDMTENFTPLLGKKLYSQAGLRPEDIDVAEIYDCFTHTVLLGLEGLGFCKKGEGGPFAASGEIALDGSIPTNTGGGMLSEAYIHGMNVIAEAVTQLRGDAGRLQVANAENVIVTSGAWQYGSGLILSDQEGG